MITFLEKLSTFKMRDPQGRWHYVARVIADTAAELNGVTSQGKIAFEHGTVAHVLEDDSALILNGSNEWVRSEKVFFML